LFLSVSDAYVPFMREYLGIPAEKMAVVPLGITMDGHHAKDAAMSPPFTIGYLGRIAPEKGLHVLAEAYRRLRRTPGAPETRLLAGGYLLHEHRTYFDGIVTSLQDAGLGDQFRYAGAPDRVGKIALLQQMDLMSMPATYDEPKGFTLLEAMANGVPVVQPDRGAFTEIVRRTGGGLLVAKDDPDALAAGLLTLLQDRTRAAEMGRAGAEGVRRQYTVDHMAAAAERAYATLRSSNFEVRTSKSVQG
jgi:glycosyltransferase involved in cell wall biosynthesis